MKTLTAALAAIILSGCTATRWTDNAGNPVPMKDLLECENQGLQATGPGVAGIWNQVQVEQNCLRARGYRVMR